MRILLLDNYDSFTHNLMHLVEKAGNIRPEVRANDKISLSEVDEFDRIILSPGPGLPSEAGIMPELIARYYSRKSILGVCLGMQAIGECFGAKLLNLPNVYHGVATDIQILQPEPMFNGCPPSFMAGRYHSWVLDGATVPEQLIVTARDDNENIMAIRHRDYNVRGVQFHPESILSQFGEVMIKNWLGINMPNFVP
jgi:anthranilate synthase component 2